MADLERMTKAAQRAMVKVLELKPKDHVLVGRNRCATNDCNDRFFNGESTLFNNSGVNFSDLTANSTRIVHGKYRDTRSIGRFASVFGLE